MTITADSHTVTIAGTPLALTGGRITIDSGSAPHVQGSIPVALPPDLTGLDPRVSPAPRVLIDANGRSFDLCLRSRPIDVGGAGIELSVASDEALLEDYAPLADDEETFTLQHSVRALVNYVLAKAIPGASLAPVPDNDADVTVYTDSVNEITNPAAAVNTTSWIANGITFDRRPSSTWFDNAAQTAFRLYGVTNRADTYIDHGIANATRLAGKTMVMRAAVRTGSALTNPSSDAARLSVFYSTNGGASYAQAATGVGSRGASTLTKVAFRFDLPEGVTQVIVRAYHGWRSTDAVLWSDFRLSEYTGDPTDEGYYDGLTPDTDGYSYDWEADSGLSTSIRSAIIDRPADSLLWRAGDNALEFLHPLIQSHGLRLVCDETRTWTLRDEAHTAPGAISLRQGVNIIAADENIDRDSGLWFDARITRYRWTDAQGVARERVDAFALPGYSRVTTVEVNAPYPGPGRSEYAVRRAQGRGREVTATAPADWTTRTEQPITITLNGVPIQTGITSRVEFDIERGEMTVSTRATDTPAGAIDLLPGTINSLTGTIDNL